jgi:hypothetical protein
VPTKTKRDALEALICERIEREMGKLEGSAERIDALKTTNRARIQGLEEAKKIVKTAFEECK